MKTGTVRLPLQTINIEDDGFHLTVVAEINNRKALLLIDTGASRTVFDLHRIRNFSGEIIPEPNEKLSTGLGTNSMVTHSLEIRDFQLGELQIGTFNAVLLDLSNVNLTYSKLGLPEIDGVLGSDILQRYQAVIDYGNNSLLLRI
jgi:hypothetical protein